MWFGFFQFADFLQATQSLSSTTDVHTHHVLILVSIISITFFLCMNFDDQKTDSVYVYYKIQIHD